MLGPFSNLPISNIRISPIGLVAKPDGGWRLITNLSAPEGNSVNSYIEEQICKVKYSSLDQILDKIYDAGHRAKLAKIDIKSAFRLLIVNLADFDLLGIKFCNRYYIDCYNRYYIDCYNRYYIDCYNRYYIDCYNSGVFSFL
jgi:hypothetical protein